MNEPIKNSEALEPEEPRPEKRFKFRRVNEITGTFVLIVIGLLIAVVVWTGRSQRWFKSNVTLRIALPEAGAAGIRQGSEVYFLGTLVGSVSDVIVDTTGRMEAQANVRYDFFRFVRADSSAVVKKKFGVAGDSFFEITRGEGKPLPEKNAAIVCKEQLQSALEAAVEEVRREAVVVLKKVNGGLDAWTKLGADLGETRQHVDEIAVRLERIAAGVEAGQGTVGKLMTDTAISDEARNLLVRANQTMSELQGAVTNLSVVIGNIREGTTRLPDITETVANDLPGLLEQTESSMREMERLVGGMQRHWLLRKYVNKTNPPPPGYRPEPPARQRTTTNTFSSPKGGK
jgi:phospholipid/cholesterol/gamma-HCH transport system substrate-binding protein